MDVEGRHPSIVEKAQYFGFDHLPPKLQVISKPCHWLAECMIEILPDNPQLALGLQKLIEAKDCFVRAGL